MGKEIKMFLRIEPPSTTFQKKGWKVTKSGRPYQYDKPETKEVRAKLAAHMAAFRPEAPLKGPIDMSVRYFYMETENHPSGTFKTTKPDLDNLNKLLGDTLQEQRFIKDDKDVCHLDILKIYSDAPGIMIRLAEMEESL